MKTYVLTISRDFPKTHKKAGYPTMFLALISALVKKHTIRGNYKLWKKRFKKIEKGEACLSIRFWEGKPYNSKQKEFLNLKNTDGIGIQKLTFQECFLETGWIVGQAEYSDQLLSCVAENDGLSKEDFIEWFKKYDFSEPMAIIHFTHFRYAQSYAKPNR